MTEANSSNLGLPELKMTLPLPPPKVRPDHSVTVAVDKTMPFALEVPEDVLDVGELLTQICLEWPRQKRSVESDKAPVKFLSDDPEYQTHASVCGLLTDPDGHAGTQASSDYFSGAVGGAIVAVLLLLLGLLALRWGRSLFSRSTPVVRETGA